MWLAIVPILLLARTQQSRAFLAPSTCPGGRFHAFIGVQTTHNNRARRDVLRSTWFPPTQQALDTLFSTHGVLIRWVVGFSSNSTAQALLEQEANVYGGFWALRHEEAYDTLTQKTMLMFRSVSRKCKPQYILKVDDDVYVRPTALPLAVAQWQESARDYIGCFFVNSQIVSNPKHEWHYWYEPQHALLGSVTYPPYARGTAYALSARAATWLRILPVSALRQFRSEDVTVAVWMMGFNATHLDDPRLCTQDCNAGIVVYNGTILGTCNGLCDVLVEAPQLHANASCRQTLPTGSNLPVLPSRVSFVDASDAPAQAAAAGSRQKL